MGRGHRTRRIRHQSGEFLDVEACFLLDSEEQDDRARAATLVRMAQVLEASLGSDGSSLVSATRAKITYLRENALGFLGTKQPNFENMLVRLWCAGMPCPPSRQNSEQDTLLTSPTTTGDNDTKTAATAPVDSSANLPKAKPGSALSTSAAIPGAVAAKGAATAHVDSSAHVSKVGPESSFVFGPSAVATSAEKPQVRDLTIRFLRPGLKPPWKIYVRIIKRTAFSSGSGFWLVLEDESSDQIAAFLFAKAARLQHSAMRIGTRGCLLVQTGATAVTQNDHKYGGGIKLVIESGAHYIAEPFRLGRLPISGPVEVMAIILDVGPVEIAQNGNTYRKILLGDETCPIGVFWYVWCGLALGVPDGFRKGSAVVRIAGCHVKQLGRRKTISNGDPTYYMDENDCEARVTELREWAKGETLA